MMMRARQLLVGIGVMAAVIGGAGLTGTTAEAAPPSPQPDLTVNVVAPGHANPGEPVVIELRVRNTGTAPALGVQVHSHVDGELNIDAVTGSDGFGCAVIGQSVLCGGADLGPGDVATIVIRTHARLGTGGSVARLRAEVDPAGHIEERHESNNSDWGATLIG